MEQKTIPVRTQVINGRTVVTERIIEKTPCEFLEALESAQTPYEFYVVMREVGFTVHAYDDFTSIGLDLVGDVVELGGDTFDDFKEDNLDNPPYLTLLWNYRHVFINAYREKVVKEKED